MTFFRLQIRREVRNLGVVVTDPCEYIRRYGSTLIRSDHLPDIAHKYSTVEGLQLAAQQHSSTMPILEGDIEALKLVDLEQTGLAGSITKTATTSYTSAFHEHISSNTAATTVGPSSISPLRINTSPRLNLSSASPEVAAATAAAAAAVGCSDPTSIINIEELYLSRANATAAASDQQNHHHSNTHESIVTSSMLNTLSSS